ncbi:hypothetical protein C4J93_4472 [Pseudomonas sp. R2-37-08W]|nr:hypothetical protein C4J93_4472 [Pseudomonas sp. R2-37-08W]AZF44400.1 hypothetical protein C4J87_4272 [Pseudomonas sp. R1-43-08]
MNSSPSIEVSRHGVAPLCVANRLKNLEFIIGPRLPPFLLPFAPIRCKRGFLMFPQHG